MLHWKFTCRRLARRQDPQLLPCVREQLTISDPIGIPLEAATELGDYSGSLEVDWLVK